MNKLLITSILALFAFNAAKASDYFTVRTKVIKKTEYINYGQSTTTTDSPCSFSETIAFYDNSSISSGNIPRVIGDWCSIHINGKFIPIQLKAAVGKSQNHQVAYVVASNLMGKQESSRFESPYLGNSKLETVVYSSYSKILSTDDMKVKETVIVEYEFFK